MNRQYKRRYVIAVYSSLLMLSLVLAVLGNKQSSPLDTLFLNLSTELLGAVVLFFLVNVFFQIGEWNVIDRVEELGEVLQKIKSMGAEDFFVDGLSNSILRKYVQNSQAIDMCGLTLNATLHKALPQLREVLGRDGFVRIIIVEISWKNLELAAMRSGEAKDKEHFIDYYRAKLCSSFKMLEDLRHEFGTTIQVRFLPYLPSYGMIQFNFIDTFPQNSILCVEIYPYGTNKGFDRVPYFVIDQKEKYWFLYFEKQFENLWNVSKEWEAIALEEVKNGICQ